MRIGIDFDNTIVCYDRIFYEVAREMGLIPVELPCNKEQVRNYLRNVGQEDKWTELQGYVYGARMAEAEPYPGVYKFFQFCAQNNIPTFIVSHKTRYPYLGPKYDLHRAAFQWLELQDFFNSIDFGITRNSIFLELTKVEKIKRIDKLKCTHFIDDLPEFLTNPLFPIPVKPILFDPNNNGLSCSSLQRFSSWDSILKYFLEQPLK